MGVLARVFEEAGIATVGVSLVRPQAEHVKAPRFLHCEFPLGRPLGRPRDAGFQTDVIRRAFSLIERTDVPVLVDHPVEITEESDEPATCPLPPRHDPALHPAVDEALGLRPAYERAVAAADGRTALGRVTDADGIGDLIGRYVRIADGSSLADVGLDADSVRAGGQDIRAYYEEAAVALSEHVPAARRVESWFYGRTRTGAVIRDAARALKEGGEDRSTWYFMFPGTQA